MKYSITYYAFRIQGTGGREKNRRKLTLTAVNRNMKREYYAIVFAQIL